MVQQETYFETPDGTKLYLYRWSPEKPPKAALCIAHGMAEHALRYERLAQKLTGAGIEVWAADQRGHGKTADLNVNEPDKGGLLGHCGDGSAFSLVTQDVHDIISEIKKTGNFPVFLLGHSWGSFIAQNYIEVYSDDLKINGCILSGTKGPGDAKVKAGIPFLSMLASLRGQRNGSDTAKNLADGAYNKPFKPNRTPFDWLSRDNAEVDKYIADPCCGMLCSSGFYRELAKLLYQIHKSEEMAKIRKDLPIYVFSGCADPVGDMGKGPADLVKAYRELGIKDVELELYPGDRHETLNETNREEVTDNLLAWLNKHS
jgi:alpha-beta hydrolase superfamily lysophospholipase